MEGALTVERALAFPCGIHDVQHNALAAAADSKKRRIGLIAMFAADRIRPILGSISYDYRRQLNFPDWVHVGIRVARIGRSSLGLEHAIVSQSQAAVAAEGSSTAVVFDYRANQPHPIPPLLRHAIEAVEGRTFDNFAEEKSEP